MNSTAFDIFKKAALLILTPHCFDNYFLDLNFYDGPCFSATLSKCLGFGLILGSLIVKLPQILKIYKSRSGEGISLLSVTLELTAITITAAYSYIKQFPFSAWGDAAFLGIQTVFIGILVLHYAGSTFKAVLYLVTFLSMVVLLISVVPVNVLWTLQGCNIFIVVSGKLTQSYRIFESGHSGQLSFVTWIMLFFGSLSRIFTSIQETGDLIIILTFIASTLTNGLVVAQILYYWNALPKKDKIH